MKREARVTAVGTDPAAAGPSPGPADPPPTQLPGPSPHQRAPAFPVNSLAATLAAALTGLALLAAFPPYGLCWLAPVGVALLTLATYGRRVRAGLGLGALTGAVFFTPLLHWTNTQAGWLPWLLLSGSQAAFLALLGGALAYTGRLTARWPLLAAPVTGVLWVAQEALRDRAPFGGFPWARLAFSQADSSLLRLAVVGGAPLVTFGVAVAGGLLAAAALTLAEAARSWRYLAGVAGLLVLLFGLAAVVPTSAPAGRTVQVAFVQGNVPRLGLDFNAQRQQVLRNHVSGTEDLARRVATGQVPQPDLVIWPENASDVDPVDDPSAGDLITQAARTIHAPILVGSLLWGPADRIRNVGLVWDPDRGLIETYVKRHPVPFAEYVPLRALARKITTKVDLVRADFVAGKRPGVLRVGPATVGDVICFEVAYDDIVRDTVTGGGQLIVTQTNNATFDDDEAGQQMAMVRLRAVEHGRDALMVSTVGRSGFVTTDGQVHAETGFNTPAAEVRAVHLSATRTLATRLGAGPEYLLLAVAFAALVGAAFLGRIRRSAVAADDLDSEGKA
jgi:apolipoprotein N-acyltransferase